MSDNKQEVSSTEEEIKIKKYNLFVLFPNLSDEDVELSIIEIK
jgi:hypothetical protein